MSYAEAIAYLQGLTQFGMRPGLARMSEMAALAGNPQQSLRFIHVAGTNGKGSTCAFLDRIYRESGLRVGLYTSPHLVRFNERIQVNGVPIGDLDLARTVEKLRPFAKSQQDAEPPTFFEFATLMALDFFRSQKVALVIWETGLGGRLDATNIVTPLASVITNIQFDHEKWLGHTLTEIAGEKAGIIKTGVPVLTATDNQEALDVIRRTAERKSAPLTALTQVELETLCPVDVPLPGSHQRLNAGLAVATVRRLGDVIPARENAIAAGVSRTQWPGRMQFVKLSGGQELLLDGAHNVAGVDAFCHTLDRLPSKPSALIVGMLDDKDLKQMVAMLAKQAPRIYVVPVQSLRTAPPDKLATLFRSQSTNLQVHECASLASALEQAKDESLVAICGSLYLIGEALSLSEGSRSDHALNDWKPRDAKEEPLQGKGNQG